MPKDIKLLQEYTESAYNNPNILFGLRDFLQDMELSHSNEIS